MLPVQEESSSYTNWERRGSSLAHASALLIGVPLMPFLGFPLAFSPCPVISYLIARSFRRRGKAWGTFQGMQASLIQLLILSVAFLISQVDSDSTRLLSILGMIGLLLFLYSLWGAWDTLFGYNFRYALIGNLMGRVSQANLRRLEPRRRWFRGYQTNNDDRPQR